MSKGQAKTGSGAESTEGRNVLIAMDGSKHAINAFEWYVKNVHRPTDKVIMAHCAEPMLSAPPLPLMTGDTDMIQSMMRDHEEHVQNVLKTIDDVASKHKVNHVLERLHGPPGEAIVNAAETQNCNMIVAGSRGYGLFRRTILGSVSDYIIHHANIPVTVCKHEDEHYKLKL